jgi:hypothetical protein
MTDTKVFLVDSDRPFLASEVEFLGGGWLRAVGCCERFAEEESTGEIVALRTEPRECVWPPHRIKEVRRG